MYDSMVDARRVRAWIEEQHSIRAGDVGSEPPSHGGAAGDSPPFPRTTATPAPPPAGASAATAAAAVSGGGFVRAEDVQSIVDARVDLIRAESRREIERLADRVRELEKRVSSGPSSGSPHGAEEEIDASHDLQLDSLRVAESESEVVREPGPESDLGSGLAVDDSGVVRQGSATPTTPDAPPLLSPTGAQTPEHRANYNTASANAAGEMDVDVEQSNGNAPAQDAAHRSSSGP